MTINLGILPCSTLFYIVCVCVLCVFNALLVNNNNFGPINKAGCDLEKKIIIILIIMNDVMAISHEWT